jgi:hypothetical protein
MNDSSGAPEADAAGRPPRVFISHASEDKERFVVPFSRLLRERRVDAWLDLWEIGPGDSLVQRIYDEGLGGADVVVAVVSAVSVSKPWVRDELAVATVRRVKGEVRVIPVVLDDATVPVALEHLAWVTVSTTQPSAARDAAQKVIARVYGLSDRPPLGEAPGFVAGESRRIAAHVPAGLTRVDALVLREGARRTLADPSAALGHPPIPFDAFVAEMHEFDLSEQDVGDAITVLEEQGLVRGSPALMRAYPFQFRLTASGVDAVVADLVEDYEAITRRVGAAIVNRRLTRCTDIAEKTATAVPIVARVMRAWADRGWLKLSDEVGTPPHLWDVSPHLRRWLAE